MERDKTRIGVFSNYYSSYRDAVFARLSEYPDLQFTFLAGSPPEKSFIPDSSTRPYCYRPIRWFAVRVPGTTNFISYRSGAIWALLRRKYDVLILCNDILGLEVWVCCLLARVLKVPVCIWGQGLSRPPSALRDSLRYALTSLSTAALYYTESGREYWVKRGIEPTKLFIAYNSLDTEKQYRIQTQMTSDDVAANLRNVGLGGKHIVIFLGRLIAEKRPQVFIEAVAKATRLNPDIVGVLVGDGPERQALTQYVHERELNNHIQFVGPIHDEPTIAKYLMSSIAMVLPAFAGLAIQHAAVYGIPVILGKVAHSHGPEQEIVREGMTGIWCPDGDIDALACAIVRLVNDHELRKSLSINIRKEIDEKYNTERMAKGFVDSVRYCIGKTFPGAVKTHINSRSPK